jgi:hypothetical protein
LVSHRWNDCTGADDCTWFASEKQGLGLLGQISIIGILKQDEERDAGSNPAADPRGSMKKNNNNDYSRIAIWPNDADRLKKMFPKKEGNTQQSAMKKLLDLWEKKYGKKEGKK